MQKSRSEIQNLRFFLTVDSNKPNGFVEEQIMHLRFVRFAESFLGMNIWSENAGKTPRDIHSKELVSNALYFLQIEYQWRWNQCHSAIVDNENQ